jgi:hypothetical protein
MADLSSFTCMVAESFDPTTLTGTFAPINGTGFSTDIKLIKIFNPSTTIGIDVSYDGVNKHDYWPPGATIIIDLQANHADNSAYGAGTLYGRMGQIIWCRTSSTSAQVQIAGYR